MRITLSIFLLTLISVLYLNAQSISTNHLFTGQTVPYLSMGNHKLGWVSVNGNFYASNLMDTAQIITTVTDTNLVAVTSGFPGSGGVTLCGSTVKGNGQLIGLFYDWNCWSDSTSILGPYNGNGCYFLYDFASQIRNYFYFNAPTFVEPVSSSFDCDYHFNWLGDTLYLTLQYTDVLQMSGTHGYCLKFLNNSLIEQGQLVVSDYVVDVFFDSDSKLNQLYDGPSGGYWRQNDGLNYYTDLTPANPTYYADAFIKQDSLYILQNHFSFTGESDSIVIHHGSSQTAIASPMPGVYTNKALCVDHAKRIWVAKKDSVYMYNGSAWSAFDFGGINLQTQLLWPTFIKSFIEYKPNCFALSFAEDLNAGGNGMLLFCYNDTGMVTSVNAENTGNSILFSPNPANNFVNGLNLLPNDEVIIYNSIAEKVISEKVNSNHLSINISNLQPGIYLIEVQRNSTVKSLQKLVISKE